MLSTSHAFVGFSFSTDDAVEDGGVVDVGKTRSFEGKKVGFRPSVPFGLSAEAKFALVFPHRKVVMFAQLVAAPSYLYLFSAMVFAGPCTGDLVTTSFASFYSTCTFQDPGEWRRQDGILCACLALIALTGLCPSCTLRHLAS